MSRYVTEAELNAALPGFLDDIESRGVAISNNAGAIMVDGYIGEILDALAIAINRRSNA